MEILSIADLSNALNLNIQEITEIKQVDNNKIKIKWSNGIKQTFIINKSIKLIKTDSHLRGSVLK